MVRKDGRSDTIAKSAKLVQRRISDQMTLYYVWSDEKKITLMFPSRHFLISIIAPYKVSITPMVVKGQPLDYTYRLTFLTGLSLKTFVAFGTIHQFLTQNTPDSEPQDTANSDESLRSDDEDFYDEDELRFFYETEASTDWSGK